MLLVAFALSSVFVACNKYDEDIDDLYGKYNDLSATVQSLKSAVEAGSVVTGVTESSTGLTFKMSNGQSYVVKHGVDGQNGADGANGADGKSTIITIDPQTNNWLIDGVDTGICAKGEKGDKGDKGDKGETGPQGPAGEDGKDGADGSDAEQGAAGATGPQGPQGPQGPAGEDGKDGKDGVDGKNAYSPYINEAGNWVVWNDETQKFEPTEISAKGASTYVVDFDYYWELNVKQMTEDGISEEYVVVKLPKTAIISSLEAVVVEEDAVAKTSNIAEAVVNLTYGKLGSSAVEFEGHIYGKQTYAAKSYLIKNVNKTLSVIVNPIATDASLYTFSLVNSRGESPYTVGAATQNMSNYPLTRAAEENKGVWDLNVDFASGINPEETSSSVSYAIATETVYGTVASPYDVTVVETKSTATEATFNAQVTDKKTRSIDLRKIFKDTTIVYDYKFTVNDRVAADYNGIELNGYTLTSSNVCKPEITVSYLLVSGKKNSHTFTAVFENETSESTLDNISWTVQNDKPSTASVDETVYYLPIAAIKSSLMGTQDADVPEVDAYSITWADGKKLNKKFFAVNGTYYGDKPAGSTVSATPVTIQESDIAVVESGLYARLYNSSTQSYYYAPASNYNENLYVKVKFNPNTALVGEYTLNIDFKKANAQYASISVPVALSIVAPANVIAKHDMFFTDNSLVLYTKPASGVVSEDLTKYFETTGLTFAVNKLNIGTTSAPVYHYPWTPANAATTTGAISVPVPAYNGNGQLTNGYECVGSSQSFTASKIIFPRVEAATYTFNVTVKSPLSFSKTEKSYEIKGMETIEINAADFVGLDVRSGKVNIAAANPDFTVAVSENTNLSDKSGIMVFDGNAEFVHVNAVLDADGNIVTPAKDVIKVKRAANLDTPIVSDVNAYVKVVVTDVWGVKTTMNIKVVVKPIQ